MVEIKTRAPKKAESMADRIRGCASAAEELETKNAGLVAENIELKKVIAKIRKATSE